MKMKRMRIENRDVNNMTAIDNKSELRVGCTNVDHDPALLITIKV